MASATMPAPPFRGPKTPVGLIGTLKHLAPVLGLLALTACETMPTVPSTKPQPRPAGLVPPPPPTPQPTGPSEKSQALATYYGRVQADLLAQGLLRTDGGGVDTPYTDTDLLRNFEAIAFYDEYQRGGGFTLASGGASKLRKWATPIRVGVEFGDSVPAAQQAADRAQINAYAARLARITGHPMTPGSNPNFHVFVVGEDDRDATLARILQIVPNLGPSSQSMLRTMPRAIHCLVMAFSGGEGDFTYERAIAIIRAEHPDLLRKSCVHEEMAQGLGLANDSPRARPSIFNDDDEFALLTTHDEELLRTLYDPRLTAGMSLDEARPILRQIITGTGPGPS